MPGRLSVQRRRERASRCTRARSGGESFEHRPARAAESRSGSISPPRKAKRNAPHRPRATPAKRRCRPRQLERCPRRRAVGTRSSRRQERSGTSPRRLGPGPSRRRHGADRPSSRRQSGRERGCTRRSPARDLDLRGCSDQVAFSSAKTAKRLGWLFTSLASLRRRERSNEQIEIPFGLSPLRPLRWRNDCTSRRRRQSPRRPRQVS